MGESFARIQSEGGEEDRCQRVQGGSEILF